MSGNRWQWILLFLVVLGFGLYRGVSTPSEVPPDMITARLKEAEQAWFRIPPYPGTKMGEAVKAQQTTSASVVSSRKWKTTATWDEVKSHFEKELPTIGWYRVGEAKAEKGQPLLLLRQDPFHMTIALSGGQLELRITWTVGGEPLLP